MNNLKGGRVCLVGGFGVFNPWSLGSIVSGPVMRDGIMAEGRNRTELHTTHTHTQEAAKMRKGPRIIRISPLKQASSSNWAHLWKSSPPPDKAIKSTQRLRPYLYSLITP